MDIMTYLSVIAAIHYKRPLSKKRKKKKKKKRKKEHSYFFMHREVCVALILETCFGRRVLRVQE